MVGAPRAAVVAAVLLLVGLFASVQPASAQGGQPANCSAANLNNWWGYQYKQQVRSTWDGYSSQSRGVCVMREASLPIPGDCRFSVEKPWWVASGSPPSPALCWWGTPTTPSVTVSAPAGCFPTVLSVRAAYNDPATRRLWDYYAVQTLGVCESTTSQPSDCRFLVQEGAGKWLCWWPARGGAGLRQVLGRSDYQTLGEAALGIQEVCDLVGSGRAVIEFRVEGERVQLLVEACQVKDIQWLTPPQGCRDIEPATYASLVGQAALDKGLADAADVCLLPRTPQQGECASSIAVAPSTHLCFYGRKTGGTSVKSSLALSFGGSPKFFVSAGKGALRTILNSQDQAETTRDLVCKGNVAMNADSASDKFKLKLAQSSFLEDRVCKAGVGVTFGYAGIDYTATAVPLDGLNVARSPDGVMLVFNSDGATLGFLPGSLAPAGEDPLLGEPMPDTLEGEWKEQVMSQPPPDIDRTLVQQGVPLPGEEYNGILAFTSLLTGTSEREIDSWWYGDELEDDEDEDPSPPDWFREIMPPVQPAAGPPLLLGPNGFLQDAPAEETILDDIEECRVICSATRGSGVFGPGAAYLGGGLSGFDARGDLQAAGLV